MKIKFQTYETIEGKRKDGDIWTAYKVKGLVLEETGNHKVGDEWVSTNIFKNPNNMDLIHEMMNLEKGDKINVKHEKDGKYWNITEFVSITDEDIKTESYKKGGAKYTKNNTGWNGRSGESHNRASALYLAFDIMKETLTDAKKKKMQVGDLFEMSDILFEYMDSGNKSNQKPAGKDKSAGDDPLDP
jgi:hypothetical protein